MKGMTEPITQSQKFTILRETTEGFPLKCKLFLNLLLSQLPQGQQIQTPKDFKKAYSCLAHAFGKLSHEEKLYFIGQVSDHAVSFIRNEPRAEPHLLHNI
jgi:hypothetical protein